MTAGVSAYQRPQRARLAAIHHTEEDAEALRQTLEGAKANLDSLFSFQEYDVAFHSALGQGQPQHAGLSD